MLYTLRSLEALLAANPFRPFFVSTIKTTFRIDRRDQVEFLRNSAAIMTRGKLEIVPIASIVLISPPLEGRAVDSLQAVFQPFGSSCRGRRVG